MGQPGHNKTTARPIATQFPGHGCMDDFTTESSFDMCHRCVLAYLLTCYPCVFVQPGTGQTFGRLLQELNVGTVFLNRLIYNIHTIGGENSLCVLTSVDKSAMLVVPLIRLNP